MPLIIAPAASSGEGASYASAKTFSVAGAASVPAVILTGVILATGDGTTAFPHFFIQPTGATAATTWSTDGTALGVNLNVAAGNLIDLRTDGAKRFSISHAGVVTLGPGGSTQTISAVSDIVGTLKGVLVSEGDAGRTTLALAGTFAALWMFNSADYVTNYERFLLGYSAVTTSWNMTTDIGGTGTARPFHLGANTTTPTALILGTDGTVTHTGLAVAGGATALTITPGGHTAVTTEKIDVNIAAHQITLTDGVTITLDRKMVIGAKTYVGVAAGGTETVSLAYGLDVAAPIQGANLTLTAASAIRAAGIVCQTAALATDATRGFLMIPTCAGTPTGTPETHTGTAALIYDTTNNKLYIYDGSWLGGTTPGAFV